MLSSLVGSFAPVLEILLPSVKEAPRSLHETLIASGGHLVICSNCGEYLTNGIAQWPGMRCALDDEGPVCGLGQPPVPHTPKAVE